MELLLIRNLQEAHKVVDEATRLYAIYSFSPQLQPLLHDGLGHALGAGGHKPLYC